MPGVRDPPPSTRSPGHDISGIATVATLNTGTVRAHQTHGSFATLTRIPRR